MTREHLTKEELRRPDEFVGFFENKIYQFQNRKKEIFGALILLLVALGVAFFMQATKRGNDQIAAQSFEKVTEKLPSNLSQATGDWTTFLAEVDTFIKTYPKSSLTPSANLYKGKAHFSLKQYTEAVTAYQAAASKLKAPYSYLAMEGEAISQMQLEKWNEAQSVLKNLSDKKDNPVRDFHLYNLALVQDQLGNATDATVTRETLAKDFPSSSYSDIGKLKTAPVAVKK